LQVLEAVVAKALSQLAELRRAVDALALLDMLCAFAQLAATSPGAFSA
jgi:DNA mismatch repair ATPase MutS